jgi:hypothetical protein
MIGLLLALQLPVAAPLVVPAPHELALGAGPRIRARTVLAPDALRAQAVALDEALQRLGAQDGKEETGALRLVLDPALASQQHHISIGEDGIALSAGSPAAVATGAATLLQLVEIEGGRASWPALELLDQPDLEHRSFMVDMGRNPHSPRTLRQVVDMLWLCKGNRLQLHLWDDQLCSWPSTAFPKLLDARSGWSLEAFRELESYAQARGVMIVPEIEAPGHSTLLRQRYPEVFGETPTDLATRPEARAGLRTLLDEVLEVFPTTRFVHIGADEAYGVPQEDQRDLINALAAHLRARGVRTLVWEGPGVGQGDNKVAEDVLHLNWDTVHFPAQQMLDAGYTVINACWNPLYIVDHYPRTMFTAVPLDLCYRFDAHEFGHVDPGFPTQRTPHRVASLEGVAGFCMPWWEGREENLFGLCLPRFAAVGAGAWNRAGEQDLAGFLQRLPRVERLFEALSGAALPRTPFAAEATQEGNLAFRGRVTPSHGAASPPFGPERLTNGLEAWPDHFLGFPTTPTPLDIRIDLLAPATVGRVRIHERALGGSHEIYRLLASTDGVSFDEVGRSGAGTRGEASFVDHRFPAREVRALRIVTEGCHGLTFPSFSRLTEVQAYAD